MKPSRKVECFMKYKILIGGVGALTLSIFAFGCSSEVEPEVSPGVPTATTIYEKSKDDLMDSKEESGTQPADALGLTEEESVKLLEEKGFVVRVVERDGEPYAITFDYRTNRINLVIVDGIVTEAYIG